MKRMMSKYAGLCLIIMSVIACESTLSQNQGWSLYLNESSGRQKLLTDLPTTVDNEIIETYHSGDFLVKLTLTPHTDYIAMMAQLTATSNQTAFLSLVNNYNPDEFVAYNFDGAVDSAEIYRQSPHDIDAWIVKTIAMQAVPVVAIHRDSTFIVAVSDSPFQYGNFTSQAFYPNEGKVALRSGDDAATLGLLPDTSKVLNLDYNAEKTQKFAPGKVLSYYHEVSPTKSHEFKAILFEVKANDRNGLRKEITTRISDYFSEGRYTDYFGALSFVSSYYNLRVNDSRKSKYWVVPSVEYSNTQYGRDAFWISMMLQPEYSAECLKSELSKVNHYAEYPIFAIIWAYRAMQNGQEVNIAHVQAYVDAVEARVMEDAFHSYWEGDGRHDFQYWADVIAFEEDDVIGYNQGLFAIAMDMANRMGLKVQTDVAQAKLIYQSMYDESLGYYPVSQQKGILSPDVLLPDLVSQIYLGEMLLPSDRVRSHFDRMVSYAKTPFGFKILSTPTGEYLPADMYDIPRYKSQVNREKMTDGKYIRGGSWFLYDNLFLIDAHLHGITEAEDMLKWRVSLEFEIGSTTYETINTTTGEPWKPNMGWNVAVYAIWRKLVDEGKADNSLFEMVNEIVKKNKNSNG